MSDVKAVRYLLANNAAMIAVVPAARIYAGIVPQGTALPAIAVTHVSTNRRRIVAGSLVKFCTSRVQVTVMASTYPAQKSTLKLVRDALPETRGTINGVNVDSIANESDGPDFRDDAAGIFMGSTDFMVMFIE